VENKIIKKKVYVGMSGGVDSSVSAALLKEQGYDVTGVFIKVWQPDFIECRATEDRLDAMRVAAELEISFITLDLEKEYKEEVVEYMIQEYKLGRTPNPDVMCNRVIKFGGFYDFAMKNGADFVATGHYARTRETGPLVNLLAGKDINKDQSYFLWTIAQEKLAHTLFPVGEIEKQEVRELARKFGLYTAEKKDSQGICFLGKISMKDFLKHYIEIKHGDVLNEIGEVIGYHNGSWFLTIGERHGFTVTTKGTNDAPYYVVAKNVDKNTITVANKKMEVIYHIPTKVTISEIHWIGEVPVIGKEYTARIRYRQPLSNCTILSFSENSAIISFSTPQLALAHGQSLVLYDGEVCLGGGILEG
jgi:tRNA-specific 2-thiouridylase